MLYFILLLKIRDINTNKQKKKNVQKSKKRRKIKNVQV